MGLYGSCMVRKALGLMEIGPPWGHTRWVTTWVTFMLVIAVFSLSHQWPKSKDTRSRFQYLQSL